MFITILLWLVFLVGVIITLRSAMEASVSLAVIGCTIMLASSMWIDRHEANQICNVVNEQGGHASFEAGKCLIFVKGGVSLNIDNDRLIFINSN